MSGRLYDFTTKISEVRPPTIRFSVLFSTYQDDFDKQRKLHSNLFFLLNFYSVVRIFTQSCFLSVVDLTNVMNPLDASLVLEFSAVAIKRSFKNFRFIQI